MDLTRWLGAQASADESVAARRARNLISGAFLGCGATLGFVVLLVLPGWNVTSRTALIAIAAAVGAGSLFQIVFAARVPVAMNHVTSVVGTVAIAAVQALAGDPVAVAAMGLLYVWIAVLTALYYSAAATAAHLAVVTAAQIGVLLWLRSAAVIPQVVLTVGTCITAAGIVSWLTRDLRQQLLTDPLTRLANRRGLHQVFTRELAAAAREGRPLCVAVLDLDTFKQLNDRDGHAAGDAALIAAADAWRRELRPTDTLARIGGDEFVVILPDCAAAAAEQVVSRLIASTPAGLGCSAGISASDGRQHAEEVLARADAAMYRAKTNGGSTLVIADLTTAPGAPSRSSPVTAPHPEHRSGKRSALTKAS